MTCLLPDNNLSRKIPPRVQNLYDDTHHVRDAGLHDQEDLQIWTYAVTTHRIVRTLVDQFNVINHFLTDPAPGLLELY